MINIKTWGAGDIVKNEAVLPIDGTVSYSHIEALEINDIDNHISIRRSVRNLVDNDEYLKILFESFGEIIYSGISGVLNNFSNNLNFTTGDVIYVDGKSFARIKPGLLKLDSELILIKPNLSIAERELEKALRLDTRLPDPEGVKIYYDLTTDTYHAKIRKLSSLTGPIVEYEFINTDTTFLDFQGGGYGSSVELMNDIKQNIAFSTDFNTRVLELNSIQLEPCFELPLENNVVRYIGFNNNHELIISDTEPYYYLWQFTVNTLNSLPPSPIVDNRSFLNPATSNGIPNTLVLRDAQGGISFNNIHVTEELRVDGENLNVNEFGDVVTKRDLTVGGDVVITGSFTVNGTATTVNTETVLIEDNFLVINKNQTGTPLSDLLSGIEVERGDLTNYQFVFREDDSVFAVGEVGDLQAVATREDNPINTGLAFWNDSLKAFVTKKVKPELNNKFGNGIMIPAYSYPADIFTNDYFNTIIDLAKENSSVPVISIINPNSGPGVSVDANYTYALRRMVGANIKVAGYISTAYGVRDINLVYADIDMWIDLYPEITGIFFDEQVYDYNTNNYNYYKNISEYAKNKGIYFVINNPGAPILGTWLESGVADVYITWEDGNYPDEATAKGDWADGGASYNFKERGALIHSQSFDENLVKMIKKYYGWIYITQDILPNPWDDLSNSLENQFKEFAHIHPDKTWVDKTDLSGATVISNLTIDNFGHPINWTTRNLTPVNIGAEPTITAGTTTQYWRGDKTWQTLNTAAVTELTNLYFTTARARDSLSATAPIVYTSSTGVISHTDSASVRHVTDTEKSNWNAANSHISTDGSSHTFINQSVTTAASPTFAGLTVNGTGLTFNRASSVLANAAVFSNIVVANGVVTAIATRNLTLADLGYTGDTNANNYTHPAKAWVDKTDLSGAAVISNLTIDSLGHPTNWTTRNLTAANVGALPIGGGTLTGTLTARAITVQNSYRITAPVFNVAGTRPAVINGDIWIA